MTVMKKEASMAGFPYRVELLAPAGSREALYGALSAGADAVYLGGERFGARAYAENFSIAEICSALRTAHVLGKKIYLTANVLTRQDELEDLVSFVSELSREGLDGVIVQDLGVLAALHEACPELPLHASTQMSVTSAEAVRYLRQFGVCRVVPARELSLSEIRTLREEDADWLKGINHCGKVEEPIEIEAFIHGAMCYSYSGRCLMSSFLGGRSGNRGRCAGTCRLPHRILDDSGRPAGPDAKKKEVYPLSMKDMCVLSILPELIDAGIHSFKIEGRMKKAVYAAGVTAIYRKYIDRCYAWMQEGRPGSWKVDEKDLDDLRSLYIRTELGTGYYHARNGRSLLTIGKPGYAGTDSALEEEIGRKYLQGLPKRGISGRAVFRIGEPARMFVDCAGVSVSAEGALVQASSARPLDHDGLSARLRKTGDSLFFFRELEIDADGGIFLPVSAVNALRRETLAKLENSLLDEWKKKAGRRPDHNGADTISENISENIKKSFLPEIGSTSDNSGAFREAGPELWDNSADSRQAGQELWDNSADSRKAGPELWALVSTREQAAAAADIGCDCIVIDGYFEPEGGRKEGCSKKNTKKTRYFCALPPVFRVNDRERIRRMIERAAERGFSGILVRTLEELEIVLEMRYDGEIAADASLYGWNSLSINALAKNCGRIVCSLELTQAQIRNAAGDKAGRMVLPVYGRVPMMETAGCVRRTEGLCRYKTADRNSSQSMKQAEKKAAFGPAGEDREDSFWYLEDRMGKRLPVRCRCGSCSNTIYNAVPVSLHSFARGGFYREAASHLCMFTTESPEDTKRILRWFSELSRDQAKGRKNNGTVRPPFSEYTNGHYRNGAL